MLTFLALEGLVRATDLDRRILSDPFKDGGILKHLEPDAFLLWRGRPGVRLFDTSEHLNSRGLRGPEIGRKRPGVRRIAVLGDSCSFGIVRSDETRIEAPKPYASLLQGLLDRSAGPGRFEVINYATIGYSTFNGLRILRQQVLRDHPDFVVFRFGFNDHSASSVGHSFSNPRNSWLEAIQDVAIRSRILSLVFFYRGTPVPDFRKWRVSAQPITWVMLEDYAWNLSHMIDLCRAHGAEPILLDAPTAPVTERTTAEMAGFLVIAGYETLGQYLSAHARYQEATARVAEEKEVTFIRTAVLPSKAWSYFSRYDIAHPTAGGHARIAQMLSAEISAQVAREQTRRSR